MKVHIEEDLIGGNFKPTRPVHALLFRNGFLKRASIWLCDVNISTSLPFMLEFKLKYANSFSSPRMDKTPRNIKKRDFRFVYS